MMKGFEVVDFLAQLIICLLFSTTIFTWPIISEGCFQIMVTNIVLDQIHNLGSCWTKPKRAHRSDAFCQHLFCVFVNSYWSADTI